MTIERALVIAALLIASSIKPVSAQPGEISILPTLNAIDGAARHVRDAGCVTEACRVIDVIDQSINILLDAQVPGIAVATTHLGRVAIDGPPGVAPAATSESPPVSHRVGVSEFARLTAENGKRQAYLNDLDALHARAPAPEPATPSDIDPAARQQLDAVLLDHPALFGPVCTAARNIMGQYGRPGVPGNAVVAVSLIDMVLRMDARDHGNCLPTVLMAMPNTTKETVAISDARILCENREAVAGACDGIAR
jgi:hypothetical protein